MAFGAPESAKLVQISTICTISGVYDSYISTYYSVYIYVYIVEGYRNQLILAKVDDMDQSGTRPIELTVME